MLSGVSSLIRHGAGIIASLPYLLALVALPFTGCATKQANVGSAGSRVPGIAKPISGSPPEPSHSPTPSAIASRPPAPARSAAPQIESSSARAAAEKLHPDFDVSSFGWNGLRVSKRTTTRRPPPSLFEEAILLGKIRAALKSANPDPHLSASTVTFKNGIATISFDRDIAPETAAAAIGRALALDGVAGIHAVFRNE